MSVPDCFVEHNTYTKAVLFMESGLAGKPYLSVNLFLSPEYARNITLVKYDGNVQKIIYTSFQLLNSFMACILIYLNRKDRNL